MGLFNFILLKAISRNMNTKQKIKSFLLDINSENYASAHKKLKAIMFEKTKKRCQEEYNKVAQRKNNR